MGNSAKTTMLEMADYCGKLASTAHETLPKRRNQTIALNKRRSGQWSRPADRRQAAFWQRRKNRRLARRCLSGSKEGAYSYCPRHPAPRRGDPVCVHGQKIPQDELRRHFIIGPLTMMKHPSEPGAANSQADCK